VKIFEKSFRMRRNSPRSGEGGEGEQGFLAADLRNFALFSGTTRFTEKQTEPNSSAATAAFYSSQSDLAPIVASNFEP
jgi:hypothetical protein